MANSTCGQDKGYEIGVMPMRTNPFVAKGHSRKYQTMLRLKEKLVHLFPIVEWLPKYRIKENLPSDVIGGLTVGIMHVPQGMAYASLAGLRPMNGLYTSLIPPLLYMIFGTSRHVSLGVFAVVSLMVGACNVRVTELFVSQMNITQLPSDDMDELQYNTAVEVVTSLGLLIGIIQIAVSILHLDFLVSFLSDEVIAGFTTGAAVHVFVAQLDKIFGCHLPRHTGIGKLFLTVRDLMFAFTNRQVNWFTGAFSMTTIFILLLFKLLGEPRIREVTMIPVPFDLFVILVATFLSFVFNFHDRLHMTVVGPIPSGIPLPTLQSVSAWPNILPDAVAISIVIAVVTISMGKHFARKHHYEINPRQEFFALGMMECISSFFPVWPASTALARTLVYEGAGTKTQLATVFSSALLLLVIYWLGAFLEQLPIVGDRRVSVFVQCFLSCIILVALKGMFVQLGRLPTLWYISRLDAVTFIVTLLATVCLDIIEGLAVGVACALLGIIHRTRRAPMKEIVKPPTGAYRDQAFPSNVRCVRFEGPLVYFNVESFRQMVQVVVDSETDIGRRNVGEFAPVILEDGISKEYSPSYELIVQGARSMDGQTGDGRRTRVEHLIVDLSAMPFLDHSGANELIQIRDVLEKKAVSVIFIGATEEILTTLERLEYWNDAEYMHMFYDSLELALDHLTGATEGENVETPSSPHRSPVSRRRSLIGAIPREYTIEEIGTEPTTADCMADDESDPIEEDVFSEKCENVLESMLGVGVSQRASVALREDTLIVRATEDISTKEDATIPPSNNDYANTTI